MKELDKKGLEFVKLDATTRISKLDQKMQVKPKSNKSPMQNNIQDEEGEDDDQNHRGKSGSAVDDEDDDSSEY